ncbi:hypothetical protein [Bremerella alba]|uniref:Lipoprotein n=1 Tax=Bremerella alba TaxID=980252 RepID=A0A7V9A823_9BACT|nr:hypothetical protein [Bremerella alba]MBA2115987.1 hypothetical protein [Bremerella alba]
MQIIFRVIILSALGVGCLGCGPGSTPVPPNPTPPAELIKTDLSYIVETGQVGSEMDTIRANIEKINEEDPTKGVELQEDFNQLEKARGNQARSIAKKMMEKL